MSRTCGGYLFTCKECGEEHLLDGYPHDEIRVPCAWEDNKSHFYNKSDFKHWHGFYVDVMLVMVKEIE